MKFFENSADIPIEIINAVSAGMAVFLCGAGVSYNAGLPLFSGLTTDVYARLNSQISDHIAEKYAYDRSEFDRTLGMLENRRHLPGIPSAVRKAVCEILSVDSSFDISRHHSILQLSQDSEGRIRLVTTNFDTLFEHAAIQLLPGTLSFAAKSIPKAGSDKDFGIFHLHGRTNDDDLNLDESDLILTSSDFGDAYLRDGWISRYIEDRMRIGPIILVGYQAEDGAMRLLLDAINADRNRFKDLHKIYALDINDKKTNALWESKGVELIGFDDHDSMYDTLAEWADYNSDPLNYVNKKYI